MGESVDKVALMIKKRTRRDAMKVVDIVGDAEVHYFLRSQVVLNLSRAQNFQQQGGGRRWQSPHLSISGP